MAPDAEKTSGLFVKEKRLIQFFIKMAIQNAVESVK